MSSGRAAVGRARSCSTTSAWISGPRGASGARSRSCSTVRCAPVRGRKSLLLFSRGFLEDGNPQAREVAAASREASTAVYFMDARGLTSISGTESAAEAPSAPQPGEFGRSGFEDSILAAAGAMTLADDTGGFSVRNTNDLALGAERIAAESRVFYM